MDYQKIYLSYYTLLFALIAFTSGKRVSVLLYYFLEMASSNKSEIISNVFHNESCSFKYSNKRSC